MSELRFAEPAWVHALWVVAAFVGLLLWLEARGGRTLGGLVGPALQDRLVSRPGAWRRRLRILLLGLAAASAVVALMRPQWGMRRVAASRMGAEIMVALDVSRSMLAEDVAPNRLERAKAEIVDLLSYLDGDEVGLIAFAGRASVLSPLTPDFGFLRLVLDQTGPGSVTRGGTKLAEPIRKAVAGFGPSEGASRAILLFTDGEDHDSFVLDAAREAAEAGVKIIAIGFGDESGSEISITDPRTGAHTLVRDADGRPVRTRLDGDTLREIALTTEGAYVPAGTGVLDLESIYDEHISRLTRGELEGTRTVRDEGYPWFVLLALVLLVSSTAVSAGSTRWRAAGLALVLLTTLSPPPARAQAVDPTTPTTSTTPASPGEAPPPRASGTEAGAAADAETPAAQEDPREVYNRAVAAVAEHAYEDAERLLERARRDAGGDDELRFHASYNLGWVGVQRAGRIQGDSPQEALDRLYRAADWFREAVRLRPDDDGARRNLEVTLERALVLADEIARANEGGVEGALAGLAERQRAVALAVAGVVEAAAGTLDPMDAGDALRDTFRAQATAQRTVLSDADQLAVRVGDERDAIEARPEDEREPEDAMRAAQLSGVLEYLHRARERMGQARRQLRRRQGQRGYRRASAALRELERARDQLRNPVEVLDRLLADGTEIAKGTALLSLANRGLPAGDDPATPLPAWLDVQGMADGQSALAERIGELLARFQAGLQHAAKADADTQAPEQAELLAAVEDATPLVGEAREQAGTAARALSEQRVDEAPASQRRSLRALADARERFLDLRGLIEAMYGDEQRIQQVADADDAQSDREEFAPALRATQQRNLDRADRLEGMLGAQAARLDALASAREDGSLDPNAPAPDPQTVEEQQQHLALANQVLGLARDSMQGVRRDLGEDGAEIDWDWVRSDAGQAVEHLEGLRLLFLSITEHLREVARQQLELSDRTRDALAQAADPDTDADAEAAPLVGPQRRLAEQSLTIANALERQSRDTASGDDADPQAADRSERLRSAGEHVLRAQEQMQSAGEGLAPPAELEPARVAQATAIDELKAALEILEPPQQKKQQDEKGQQQQQQQQQEQQQQQQAQQQPQGSQGQQQQARSQQEPGLSADPSQLLQEVRDREAQRRRERARRPIPHETVEKDW